MTKGRFLGRVLTLACGALISAAMFTTVTARAADDNSTAPKYLPNPIDSSKVTDLLQTGMDSSKTLDEQLEALRYAAKFPYQDVVDTLIAVLNTRIQQFKKIAGGHLLPDENFKYLYGIIAALGDVATTLDMDEYMTSVGTIVDIYSNLTNTQIGELIEVITDSREKIETRLTALQPLPKPSTQPPVNASIRDQIADFQNQLETLVKGQPDAIKKLTDLRSRDLFMGYRENPSFMWFLGPPGTGKDTAVRAFLTAIHHDKKAYETHMYRVDPLRTQSDVWTFLGSSTGFLGSDEFPPILQFLVDHSGGRYAVDREESPKGEVSYSIRENKKWQPGDVLPGYSSPDQAVIYLDEFQDWSMQLKNAIVKKSVEYGGYWKINNPNGGLAQIYVPVTIIASSNDGLELVTSREKNGERFGRPLTYDEMKRRADRVRNNPLALRASILRGNGAAGSKAQDTKGTSEELLNRVADDHLILFDPISPQSLREISETKLLDLRADIQRSRAGYDQINLTWTPAVVDFLQEYHYVAEDQARPIATRVRSLVEKTIIDAAKKDLIKPNQKINVLINVVKNTDNTWTMTFKINDLTESASEEQVFDLAIANTENDKARAPMTDEQIDKVAQLPAQLKAGVVGQEYALDKIGKSIALSQEGRDGQIMPSEAKEPARTFMLLGPTSTGKTETAKIAAEVLFGSRLAAVTIDCTSLQTVELMHRKFLGFKDANGEVVASDFMKHYDRNNGNLIVVLDELANVKDKDVLNALFDLLREPSLATFADGHDRVMSNVIFVITGNASQEILAELPKNLPEWVLRETWSDIYNQLESDPQLRRSVLERYFTPPLLARIGDDRIFFYKPLGYSEVRRLTQMKFEALIDSLEPKDGHRGWSVRAPTSQAYAQIIEVLESQGFKTQEQGASIDTFIRETFGKELHSTLFFNKVADGAKVELSFDHIEERDLGNHNLRNVAIFNLKVSDGKNLSFEIIGKPVEHGAEKLKRDLITTSGHEAGHAIVGLSLLSDFEVPNHVRVLPGVTRIGDNWIYYAGVANSDHKVEASVTREYIVRQIAVLMGGTVAENLIVKGGLEAAGRQNDLQRATRIAEQAILKFGMSPRFGKVVLDKNALSDGDRDILRREVSTLLREGEELAKKAIIANKDLFVNMMNDLAHVGELNAKDFHSLLDKNGLVREYDKTFDDKAKSNASEFNLVSSAHSGMEYSFVSTLPIIAEAEVVDLKKIVDDRKTAELSSVAPPKDASIAGRPSRVKTCREVLEK